MESQSGKKKTFLISKRLKRHNNQIQHVVLKLDPALDIPAGKDILGTTRGTE